MERPPVVSGTFYPKDPNEIISFIKKNLTQENKVKARGAILPHAGYIYSGKTAIKTLSCIELSKVKKIFLLGPNHTGLGPRISLYPKGYWKTPLGKVGIDWEITEELAKRNNLLQKDTLAHQQEHSLEVELPLLQYFIPEFEIVPILIMQASLLELKQIGALIAEVIQEKGIKEEVLIIASSDMNHYENHNITLEKDQYAIEALLNLNAEELAKRIIEKDISMCGVMPAACLIYCLKKLGIKQANLIEHTTSAQISGDYNQVVGYAGIVFF